MNREALRRSFKPEPVRVLFIGEAPPASGRFFYRGDSGLYRAVSAAFEAAFPGVEPAGFLDRFRDLGCYLVDLCATPVDRMPPALRHQARRESEERLAAQFRRLQPRARVTLLQAIESPVRRAETLAGWEGERMVVPYPGRWVRHRERFTRLLVPALVEWRREGILNEVGGASSAGFPEGV